MLLRSGFLANTAQNCNAYNVHFVLGIVMSVYLKCTRCFTMAWVGAPPPALSSLYSKFEVQFVETSEFIRSVQV